MHSSNKRALGNISFIFCLVIPKVEEKKKKEENKKKKEDDIKKRKKTSEEEKSRKHLKRIPNT